MGAHISVKAEMLDFQEAALDEVQQIRVLGASLSYIELSIEEALSNEPLQLVEISRPYALRLMAINKTLGELNNFVMGNNLDQENLNKALEMKSQLLELCLQDGLIYRGYLSADSSETFNLKLDFHVRGLYLAQKQALGNGSFDYLSKKAVAKLIEEDISENTKFWDHSKNYLGVEILALRRSFAELKDLEEQHRLVEIRSHNHERAKEYTLDLAESYNKRELVGSEMKSLVEAWNRYASLNVASLEVEFETIKAVSKDFAAGHSSELLSSEQVEEAVIRSWRLNKPLGQSWKILKLLTDEELSKAKVYSAHSEKLDSGETFLMPGTHAYLSQAQVVESALDRLSSEIRERKEAIFTFVETNSRF